MEKNKLSWPLLPNVSKCILVAEIFTVYLKMGYFACRVDLKFYNVILFIKFQLNRNVVF